MASVTSGTDSDDTMCSQEIPCFDTDYDNFFKTLSNKIWLHTHKEDFFEKSSIEHYLNVLSKIESNDKTLNCAIETYSRQLQFLKTEMEAYEETVKSLNSASINFGNLTEDQEILRNVRYPNDDEREILQEIRLAESGSVANISESLFTNNDFKYLSSQLFSKEDALALVTETDNCEISNHINDLSKCLIVEESSEASGNDTGYKGVGNPPKKRKLDEADLFNVTEKQLFQNLDTEDLLNVKAIVAMAKLNDNEIEPANQIENYVTDAFELDELPDMRNPKYKIFNDHEMIKRYLNRLKDLIKSFQTSCNENVDKLIEAEKSNEVMKEKKLKEKFNPFFYKPGDPIPIETVEEKMGKVEPTLTLEELSTIFAEMYRNLPDKDDDE